VGYPDGVKGYQILNRTTNQLFIDRSVQFSEGSSSTSSDYAFNATNDSAMNPIGFNYAATDPTDFTSIATYFSSTTSDDINWKNYRCCYGSYSNTILARQTLQAAGTLVGDPADTRRAHSQFQGAPHALSATEPLLLITATWILLQIHIYFMRPLEFRSGMQQCRRSTVL